MKQILIVSLICVLTIINQTVYSQSNSESRDKTRFAYTIGNVEDIAQLEKMKITLSKLEHVEKVQLNYKDEQATKAQLIVYVNEPSRTSEGQIMFDSKKIKETILTGDIDLLDLKIDNY